MKKLISIFLIVALNSGCGVLKHTKNTAQSGNQTAAKNKTQAPHSETNLDLQNLSLSSVQWIARSGEKFRVIGEFKHSETNSLLFNRNDNLIVAGSLRASWESSTYSANDPSPNPTPTKTSEVKEYPEITAYFAQSSNSPNVLIVVPENNFDQLALVSSRHEMSYDAQMRCHDFTISDPAPIQAELNINFDRLPAHCNGIVCAYTLEGLPTRVVSYAQFLQTHPGSTCNGFSQMPTRSVIVTDTLSIQNYEVALREEFQDKAARIRFKAAAQN